MRRRPLIAAVFSVSTLTLLLTACGDDDASSVQSTHMPNTGMDEGSMGGHGESSPVAPGARRIDVAASSFEFDPARITVTAGEDVAIVLTSEDLLHDFTIDELDAHVAADADETNEGGLRAGEPGRYTFYCTIAGERAAGMEGTLVVE